MGRIPATQITSWSYSRYSDYKLCPLKAKLKHVDKIKEPPNDAMKRGIKVHDDAEKYIKGDLKKLPAELSKFKDEFNMLKKQYKRKINGMVVEDNWSFTNDWDETTWNDWVNCWVRIKLDCAYHIDDDIMVIRDWKTGKFRPDNQDDYIEQLELYALACMLLHEHINVVYPSLVYVDAGIIFPEMDSEDEKELTFTRDQIPALREAWSKRVKPMFKDKTFAPKPNFSCKWCFFSKANKPAGGGQCKF